MTIPTPSRSGSPESPALRVSLAGTPQGPPPDAEAAIAAALENAMANLNAASDSSAPEAGSTVPDSARVFALFAAMSSARSRRDAVVQFVQFLCSQSEGAVRCGLGKGRINYLFDNRLGWLGPESSVHQQFASSWDAPSRREDDPIIDGPSAFLRGEIFEIHLPQPDGTGRCVVWIDGNDGSLPSLTWLQSVVPAITAVLWSRPSRSWPNFAIRLARRTSISLAVAALIVGLLAVWPVHYRVPCTARVETTRQRLVSTPFEATLLKTHVKPGDTVKSGDVLLELDGRPLRLEREATAAEMQQVAKEHDVALATRRIADAQQAALRKEQLTRQHDLLTDRLGRLEVTSPIDGVVVSGDLEKFVGSPLELGQALIEVAPMNQMVIEVEIPEYEIGYVRAGADARLKLDAIGGKSIRSPLSEIYPSAEMRDERNVFVGRIAVENPQYTLRPGMRGEATVYGPLRPWAWSWIRGGVERALWWIGY